METDKGKRELSALSKRMEWLGRFKAQLVADINAAPYPQPIARKNGQPLPGVPTRASDAGVECRTPYGGTAVYWTDLSLDTMLLMAKSYTKPDLPPDTLADRQWWLGVFSFFAGHPKEGRELLVVAAQVKAEYNKEIEPFLQFAEAP